MSKLSSIILIAEDDSRTRKALVHSLQAADYQVIAAVDGQEALELFHAAEHIDLVILDVLMPRLNGFEVCQALRAISDVPIIMATVLGSSTDRVTGLEMGANDYIVKPFSMKELIARIRSILRRSTRRSEKPKSTSLSSHQSMKVGRLTIDP
ncbi:MAG: response regulator, partial [Phormidesmis sp.]